MNIFLPLLTGVLLIQAVTPYQSDFSKGRFGGEVFFLNLEDGYFGCQVNESTDYLQLYDLSKLCDGTQDCYLGSDEKNKELKCTNNCDKDGTQCLNGVCLNGVCHCNDGFGGCNCQVSDENECKYRPCDVFAHCTNTLGSFTCTCFPGYLGDGQHCEDIDECQDPKVSSKCVENAECCNLPAHFLCKCKSGFEGDGEVFCNDIDECLNPNSCGSNAICLNTPGNYTCECPGGYEGNPFNGCIDIDECAENPNICSDSNCVNLLGSYKCECPQGYEVDSARGNGCVDVNECLKSPCGRNAQCSNEDGAFKCACLDGYSGDAMTECLAVCLQDTECAETEICNASKCLNPCDLLTPCGINAECRALSHAKLCSCPHSFTGNANIECVRIPIGCSRSSECLETHSCVNNMCLPKCSLDQDCALNEKCLDGNCLLSCRVYNDCFLGHICLNNKCVFGCHSDDDCSSSESCRDNKCINPCLDNPCGINSMCSASNHRASCNCLTGLVPNPTAQIGCVRSSPLSCSKNSECPDQLMCINSQCMTLCASDDACLNKEKCVDGACKSICVRDDECSSNEICFNQACEQGCRSNQGCPLHLSCSNNQCLSPCDEINACGTNAICEVREHNKYCLCNEGLVGNPELGCKPEIVSCVDHRSCGPNKQCYGGICQSKCRNDQNCLSDEKCIRGSCRSVCNSDESCDGGQICENRICQIGCRNDNMCSTEQTCINKKCKNPCEVPGQCGLCAECSVINHGVQCSCPNGFIGDGTSSCVKSPEVCNEYCQCDEHGLYCAETCSRTTECSCGQICHSGKCRSKCSKNKPCPLGQKCERGGACVSGCNKNVDCNYNSICENGQCVDPCTNKNICGVNAICTATDHQAFCYCPDGFRGEPSKECKQVECESNTECDLNQRCDNGVCVNPCLEQGVCGLNAQCKVINRAAECLCPPNHIGNPKSECESVSSSKCSRNPCGNNSVCKDLLEGYECKCMDGCYGDAEKGCICGDDHTTICSRHQCGDNALCHLAEDGAPECYCPQNYPYGDPSIECAPYPPNVNDCRTQGCDNGECIRQGVEYICKKEIECKSTSDCSSQSDCINLKCVDPCAMKNPCNLDETCTVESHRTKCSKKCECTADRDCKNGMQCDGCSCLQSRDTSSCDHCKGQSCDPTTGACFKVECTRNEDCDLTEACINKKCEYPCDIQSSCAYNAVCINTNHGTDCSCLEGYQGNPYVGCQPVLDYKPICHYNEDCPQNQLCDRLNRRCMSPCLEDSCGENANCIAENHGFKCECPPGYFGNAYIDCGLVQGCRSNSECNTYDACVNGKCSSPCKCGSNALCDVTNHKAKCKCPPGYNGNPLVACSPPSNQCEPNPCGTSAVCELDKGNPICYCPKGLTGNPFKSCIPDGNECPPNQCGPNSGCRLVKGVPVCFCLPEYEGSPPSIPCKLPSNPCNPSPCGPNTQCAVIRKGFSKCTCLPGYIESPNTIRGCIEPIDECEPNPCGLGAVCDSSKSPKCYCPENTIGNAFKECVKRTMDTQLCNPGPCGANANCYIEQSIRETCYCIDGYFGNPYVGCKEQTKSSGCNANTCGSNAYCTINEYGENVCVCSEGLIGDPYSKVGCHGFECQTNNDCSNDKTCMGFKCHDPCPGACGYGADCRVDAHHPVCYCKKGLVGNPNVRCFVLQIQEIPEPKNPCKENPCGVNTECNVLKNRAVCSCISNYLGNPQTGCYPECVINSDCPEAKSCIHGKCVDPCSGALCGINSLCRVSHNTPYCQCSEGYTGNAMIQCFPVSISKNISSDPCTPSPCGTNDICSAYNSNVALCNPCFGTDALYSPYCRPECLSNSECPFNKACLSNRCIDPCPGACGHRAKCQAINHKPMCSCPEGLYGNPYEQCSVPSILMHPENVNCNNIVCGSNSECKTINRISQCVCKQGYFGNPLMSCHPECTINPDCLQSRACINSKCIDPCESTCGANAVCNVINHTPLCSCPAGYTGNANIECNHFYLPPGKDSTPENPCEPTPCGPNSRCLVSPEGYATCSCLPNFKGAPPYCQYECVINSDCTQNKACLNHKCTNPCVGTCGINAICETINHNPICSCETGYEGDPFTSCYLKAIEEFPRVPENPCVPSPCGPNSICQVKFDRPVCSCIENYVGVVPRCRPECTVNSDCPQNKACLQDKCQDPCINACGFNAKCVVVSHSVNCICDSGFIGDAFIGCSKSIEPPRDILDPCHDNPCAQNALCKVKNNAAKCVCITPYIGDPYLSGCRPECVFNPDCPSTLSCIKQHCRDPCIGTCGTNAQCTVVNHLPSCNCINGFEGDPFSGCNRIPVNAIIPISPCEPSPCGPNSICRNLNGRPTCSCQTGFFGSPPSCRPECIVNSECKQQLSCINHRCQDPCVDICGINAECKVFNHNPICSCMENYIGDPFELCSPKRIPIEKSNPCLPSPCGPNSECKDSGSQPVCSCVTGMFGVPPNCRPECIINQDCPSNRACIRNKCEDPCVGACGYNARCSSFNHKPVCNCMERFEGDPYSGCNPERVFDITYSPCSNSPCGTNAVCKEKNGVGACTCLPDYFGNPHINCKPECVLNSECDQKKSCVNMKCVNPCENLCGINTECRVTNHHPMCTCLEHYIGNPLEICILSETKIDIPSNPCLPSPCGVYSVCRVKNDRAVCRCLPNHLGSPPNCRPECVFNSDCRMDSVCRNSRCIDPCPGVCGLNAVCRIVNRSPICTCNVGYSGDPFTICHQEEIREIIQIEPCHPSPCGPNSICRRNGLNAVCACSNNFIGRPPNCRPECTINSQCSLHLACINNKCGDPCIGNCGNNAKCQTTSHTPRCTCENGYTGNPFDNCILIVHSEPTCQEPVSPCQLSLCGTNAVCNEKNDAFSCKCISNYIGDPHVECRPECVINNECPSSKSCVNNKCVNPCTNICGSNSNCYVVNHIPMCGCINGFSGNAYIGCDPIISIERFQDNPCEPSPCGANSKCKPLDNLAICSCLPTFIGSPPNCRPECILNSDCDQNKACKRNICENPCLQSCGLNADCKAINHRPICSCRQGFTGNAFINCAVIIEQKEIYRNENPCIPSPCGPNSHCSVVHDRPVCSCISGFIGSAPNCRHECSFDSECPSDLACINFNCKNPCIGSCGINSECVVKYHRPICTCREFYFGDPYSICSPVIVTPKEELNPCSPSPCGDNAECKERNGAGACSCLPTYQGDPYVGCRPECVLNTDCNKNLACINNNCKNPCQGVCGSNAECYVINHSPICNCLQGFTGNPSSQCTELQRQVDENPCQPSPCGPYSTCLVKHNHAVCSCLKDHIGSPPSCRPECIVSSECQQNKACLNLKCVDPCIGSCGRQAICSVINHNPICSCPEKLTGDPFTNCLEIEKYDEKKIENPCLPTPCGPNSKCKVINDTPVCSCLPNYVGRAPNCRPECTLNNECLSNQACINNKCTDPCIGICGYNAVCSVRNHKPTCLCEFGYSGDPYGGCNLTPKTEYIDPCNPSPCGSNAVCKEKSGVGSCTCLPEYQGDPYTGCRPECVLNTDCTGYLACIQNKCKDPCPGVCGENSVCQAVNHAPICSCLDGFVGNPLILCQEETHVVPSRKDTNVCDPSPCGPYSQCREINDNVVCSCLPNLIGSPPNCKPECIVSSDCPQDKSCINQKCVDPCIDSCGTNSRCIVINHYPSCSCSDGFIGDPFNSCTEIEKPAVKSENPCLNSPCGPYSKCVVNGETAACSCLPNYTGRPPYCRPECMSSSECDGIFACVNQKCVNPCLGACGVHTICTVVKHNPTCQCEYGYTGDPFSGCTVIIESEPTESPENPCQPSPCGVNAVCKERNGIGSCSCLSDYIGNPYTGCRPECVQNSDCDKSRACINNKCRDPCPGACGLNAECRVYIHAPNCQCLPGFTGNPIDSCDFVEVTTLAPVNPCKPSPCGPYSQCRIINNQAACSCLDNFIGYPPNCKPECIVSSECPQNKACIEQTCETPCPGTCGVNARCHVINHNAICTCAAGFSGDPFISCAEENKAIEEPKNVCVPSPCGPNSKCIVKNNQAACTCLVNYVGRPPYCRLECTSNDDCENSLSCINDRCINPCLDSCGVNSECKVIRHNAICTCRDGYEGDPSSQCYLREIVTVRNEYVTPCKPNPCGPNAECKEQNNAGACFCKPGYEGNPYEVERGCKRECEVNNDCTINNACVKYKCINPCINTCGTYAICTIDNHIPVCTCPPGMTGDPFSQCSEIQIPPTKSVELCSPSPCGPNSLCKVINSKPVCSCQPGFVDSPPNCRPECIVSSECSSNKACINNKCGDPCTHTCGFGALCTTVNHSPICSCPVGLTGDPFAQCTKIAITTELEPTAQPPSCLPSPCGPNSKCQIIGQSPACSCLNGFIGNPPNCRPECVINSECQASEACVNLKCRDPCSGSCGIEAKCHVMNHIPICTCLEGFSGDPFVRCFVPPIEREPTIKDKCNPSSCGSNAVCYDGDCKCQVDYYGNPFEGCRPECSLSSDCPRDKSCQRNKCVDPCPGLCGRNAKCETINHIPICSCLDTFEGDPFDQCKHIAKTPIETPEPCNPSPCGPNSQCRNINDHAVCSCLIGYIGNPPRCRPECVVNSECSSLDSCQNKKCVNPCQPNTCGVNARCEVINHSPICACMSGKTGDPFKGCYEVVEIQDKHETAPEDPCLPTPCGLNSLCKVIGEHAVCQCLAEFIGTPPNCRPECIVNSDCKLNRACINNKCQDPCPNACGLNAECRVLAHVLSCSCPTGYVGNAFVQCLRQIGEQIKPCDPSPCGQNAVCEEINSIGKCRCIDEFIGNPYDGCRPECVINSECESDKACINNKCADPCPGICGRNAKCYTTNHIPSCVCLNDFEGDAFNGCYKTIAPITSDPCSPSPCGPNSNCKNINNAAVCSCLENFVGTAPNCQPECVLNSECPQNSACYKYKCRNPCEGACGINSKCNVINHNPICSCPSGMIGDPFSKCVLEEIKTEVEQTENKNPCVPSPCGLYSKCIASGDHPVCSCIQGFIGSPPNCRPECVVNSDCQIDKTCVADKCVNPCEGACGFNSQCRVQNHIAICLCDQGYTGDPFIQCTIIMDITRTPPQVNDPCSNQPCGSNAACRAGVCSCETDYFGNPYVGCRPECVLNTDCSPNKACINRHCVDPCPNTCGIDAICEVSNHIPICSCRKGYEGDPFKFCREIEKRVETNPCKPSPCGPNSVCNVRSSAAVCACQTGMIGSPPYCKPECIGSSECNLNQACINQKCVDPCPGSCSLNSICKVTNHIPICICDVGYTGDPFNNCHKLPTEPIKPFRNPCEPSPCGPNSDCSVRNDRPVCQCLVGYLGVPPNCRPECTINPECSTDKSCIRQRCENPCIGSCGFNAKCEVANHIPICSCGKGFTGDPFVECVDIPAIATKQDPPSLCDPNPCGVNSECQVRGNTYTCSCVRDYIGNPFEGCRPECVENSECLTNKACIKLKCMNPCIGACGINAECYVNNHIPVCTCINGYTGDSFRQCTPITAVAQSKNDCDDSVCGPNSQCRILNGRGICECLNGYFGDPNGAGCKPECVISSDCQKNKICIRSKCIDPCEGTCGYGAQCTTVNHNPICSCPQSTEGNPFIECHPRRHEQPENPCYPSPCSENGVCRIHNNNPICIYPECITNEDCNTNSACLNKKCINPCINACGLNSVCETVNHNPVCICPNGFYGSPYIACKRQADVIPEVKPECSLDSECSNDKACVTNKCMNPCLQSNICSQNAQCRVQNHRPLCVCNEGYAGNAQLSCFRIGCQSDSECPNNKACISEECVNPCTYTKCGENAECSPEYHKGRCSCKDEYFGNPLVKCLPRGCTSNNECDYNLACINTQCRDPCNCGQGAECRVNNHIAQCLCPDSYEGDPITECIQRNMDYKPKCSQDKDCSTKLACISAECKNPCTLRDHCGRNSNCRVIDTLPVRTMICECLAGFINAENGCVKVIKHESECTSNYDCATDKMCQNELCINPCAINSPCARTAICQIENHLPTCSCPPGSKGDPFYSCYEDSAILVGCGADSECPSTQACINKLCQNPCSENHHCDDNSECRSINHRPVCVCPKGWSGNPQTQCYKPECKINSDCFDDKKCINEKCINPCLFNNCGLLAECIPRNHEAFCQCPDGKQGNPHISCITSQCQYNEDCPADDTCDRLNRICRPACDQDSCAEEADCIVRDHQPHCRCNPGRIGNPYIECITPKNEITVECRSDGDCRNSLTCINQKCENPCSISNPCSNQQSCQVIDHSPVKTIICKCPPDTTNDDNGNCIPVNKDIKQYECDVNEDCSDKDACVRGVCVLACRSKICGINSICQSTNHYGICSCPDGYDGNPNVECSRKIAQPKIPLPECEANNECPINQICKASICVNPCLFQNPCAKNAFCHAENRNAVCRCPDSFIGDPNTTGCSPKPTILVVGCKSNSECKDSESCINSKCFSPCNCGVNANCIVRNHHPVCMCKNGFYGNAQIGCYNVDCQTDSECPDDKRCLSNQCVNPCAMNNPCAQNAECYGSNHKSNCKCLSGLTGDGFISCQRVECKSDYDCPSNKACDQDKCVDLCLFSNPCAENANCYMHSHRTQCRCPPQLPNGNPYSYCEKPRVIHECIQDGDCRNSLVCIDNKCKDACSELSPCAKSADCSVLDSIPVRTMICQCPTYHVPDVNGECTEIAIRTPGCTTNDECNDSEACINRKCRDPCNCGDNAHCEVKDHRAICSCAESFEGNPYLSCQTIGCRSNSECESNKACVNGDCINECLINNPCGVNADCYMDKNRPLCKCRSGYRGNPFIVCRIIECSTNNDCPNDNQCHNEKCINPCVYNNKCGPKAECFVQNHKDSCRCSPGYYGNPFVKCVQNNDQCILDSDCPTKLACLNSRCVNPCHQLEPCTRPSICEVISTQPMKTMICICPDGYVSSGSGSCKPTKSIVKIGCISDGDCEDIKSCVNGICRNPCNCGSNAECRIKDHKPICTCAQGYQGNPEIRCVRIVCTDNSDCASTHSCINKQCVPACQENNCGKNAECFAVQHTARCECISGYTGNPNQNCLVLGCRADSDCPNEKACINGKCENPCESTVTCSVEEVCRVYNHKPECICPTGQVLIGSVCQIERTDICLQDSECPTKTGCISGECTNPCDVSKPCGVNADCKVLDTVPVRTMICECKDGFQGNAAVQCDKTATCLIEKGFVRDRNGKCACPPGKALDIYEYCSDCIIEKGYTIDSGNHCVCALERGMIIDVYGNCKCPTEHGYQLTTEGECIPVVIPECTTDSDCSNKHYCNKQSQRCEDPCLLKVCGINAFCNAISHEGVCQCITGYTGNPEEFCNHTNFRTDFPRPDMVVSCLADGVSVQIHITEPRFNGVLYVKGHSKEEECRKVVNLNGDAISRTELFKVQFGNCGLIHDNGIANFILVIQKHPKLVTYKAQAYNIKCVYQTGEKNVTLGFNVSMLTTAGTIANTGPPPVCQMRIVTQTGQEINSAEIGDNLMLQVDIEPATIYGGFARSCIAKTMEDSVENEYIVTDENGCATEPGIFGEWEYNPDTNSLLASFNAFKFPSSDNIRFQCNIRVCFGKCQPVNCRGYNAFGRRRRREISRNDSTEISVGNEGQLREEITIQSNAILTFDKKETYLGDSNIKPSAQRVEDICVSMVGLIIALVITALLALVAVAVAVSCWLMAYRRTPKSMGPLPHPPEFPNPLFTNPEAVSEPAPDYIS